MLFSNRRVAFALLWVANHIPFYRNKFDIEITDIILEPDEAAWTPEQRMQLESLLAEDPE